MGAFADLMANVVTLEERVKVAAKAAKQNDEPRVYEWRPSGVPELPAIWNWIDDAEYSLVDTGRADNLVVVTATIGVKPSDLAESMGQLVRLVDVFTEVVDPALDQKRPLGARYAKRSVIRTRIDEFNGVPVMCMDLLIRCELTAMIRGGG